ncbi:M61 family metallopeptidase [Metallosphaera tengchongensis]|uniref:M61 family metallopeptidase n=1 Tax=Metallosphaera tengchongensis TaxID=1532350 RepID=A0A6N0NZ17_9CREN|nr:M61 family metallopeptidase [Metallosphaera tengchongensis]QKR00391.1 M61 family metallopeptidase [Metallosphaera tengchongensis]
MLFEVTPRPRYIEVEAWGREGTVTFPTYVPGSYVVRELERNIVKIDGFRVSKNRFYVRENFKYTLYANSKDQREAISTHDYLFINPPAVFPFQDKDEKYCIKLKVSWPVKTTLREEKDMFCGDSYHEFVDSPIQASPALKTISIDESHEVSTVDDLEVDRIRDVIKEIDKEMGSPQKYVFFFRRSDRNFGGIEHADSSAIVVPWDKNDIVTLFAHEYFHRWNVKRFRPKDLELDLEVEAYSDLLGFAEGVTDYVAVLSTLRARGTKVEDIANYLANAISKLTFPGARMSLAESSRTTWIKYYKQDENFLNTGISYYDAGMLMGLYLDAKLRERGANIFHIFRNIPNRYTLNDIDSYLRKMGIEVFEDMIYSPASNLLNYLRELMEIELIDAGSPYFGLLMDGSKVTFVEDGSPADIAGLIPQDTILGFDEIARAVRPKPVAELTISREGRIKRITITAGKNPGHKVKFRLKGKVAQAIASLDELTGISNINII